jgi:predicted transcriptional regulator
MAKRKPIYVRVTVTMDDAILRQLDELAASQHRSRSNMLHCILYRALHGAQDTDGRVMDVIPEEAER